LEVVVLEPDVGNAIELRARARFENLVLGTLAVQLQEIDDFDLRIRKDVGQGDTLNSLAASALSGDMKGTPQRFDYRHIARTRLRRDRALKHQDAALKAVHIDVPPERDERSLLGFEAVDFRFRAALRRVQREAAHIGANIDDGAEALQ